MKKIILLFCLLVSLYGASLAQEGYLYQDDHIPVISVWIEPDSLEYMLANYVHERYMPAEMIFDDGIHKDSIHNIGLRLRGNTSLYAQKKSFKISFNAFDPDGEYQNVRKLNLLGSHNDPTMAREKLFYHVWEKAGMPPRRCNFVKLYINTEYRGLYTNMEEFDKRWLKRNYPDNDGNFFKCTYPADLAYLGEDQQLYKSIMNNPESRAYDLVTNETTDDYSRLVALTRALNKPVDANFKAEISQILNVESVLKAFAIDVATGNWDDYFYNKNNYYLYDNPLTQKFEFITYDTDNSFGVDWLGKDWATRDCLQWQRQNEARPLATKLLQVADYYIQYVVYLDSVTRYITHPDSIFPLIDTYRNILAGPAFDDYYRTLDYGYTVGNFYGGFTEKVDDHTPYGIKPFLELRSIQTLQQIDGLIEVGSDSPTRIDGLLAFPNPASDWLFIRNENPESGSNWQVDLYSTEGKPLRHFDFSAAEPLFKLNLANLPSGCLIVQITGEKMRKVVKLGIRN